MALAGKWLARCQRAAAAAVFHQTDIGRLGERSPRPPACLCPSGSDFWQLAEKCL
jgi:hypothetical protein